MRVSARNVFEGTVKSVLKGLVNAQITLVLQGGETIIAVITNTSAERLGLKEGSNAYAILKSSWVILGQDLDAGKISARNVLRGTVSGVHEGAVNNEVAVTLSGGSTLTAIITKESSHALGLKEGGGIFAAFKANNVILAVD